MKISTMIFLMTLAVLSDIYSQDFWVRTNGLDNLAIGSLGVNSSGDLFAGTDTNYIFRSTDDGSNWTNLGYKNLKTTGIVIKPTGEIFISSLDHHLGGGVFHSTDNGNSWTNMGFTGPGTAIAINSNGHIFVGHLSIGIFRSTDNGGTWIQINQGLTDTHPISFLINPSGDIFAGTMFGGVFRSTDNGNNWVSTSQGLTTNHILSLAINSGLDIFAGTEGGGVFRSTNNGGSWVQINDGLAGQGLYVRSLAIHSNGVIFAGTAGGILRSADNGENWFQINQGLTSTDLYSLAINSNSDVYAGTSDGVFRSLFTLPVELTFFIATVKNNKLNLNWQTATEVNNYGFDVERSISSANNTEWQKIGFVQGYGNCNSPKEYSFTDNKLVLGSKFQYRLKQIDNDGQFEYSKVVEVKNVPTEFALYQNFPNPFNPTTTIRYQLPNESKVVIKIYNILGSEVMELLSEQKEAGVYELEFNSDNLSSGTYIYRIIAGSFIETKKMILIK